VEIVDDFDSLSSTKLSEAEILGFDASHIELVTTMNPAGYLIAKWFNSPDWRCFLDGNATPISENKWGFMYVNLPTGNHRVEMTLGEQHMFFISAYLVVLAAVTVLGATYGYMKSPRGKKLDQVKTIPKSLPWVEKAMLVGH